MTTPARPSAARHREAALVIGARRTLVTGFVDASLDVVTAAFDLAESLGAAVDAGEIEVARASGPTIARVGELTADPEELRDRADLVVLWCCEPDSLVPGFHERFIAPPHPGHHVRRVLAVSPHDAIETAQAVLCRLRGIALQDPPDPVATASRTLHAAILDAGCVAFVTAPGTDALGLGDWGLVHLMRAISHRIPAFEVPLAAERLAAFRACCTWRYGAAGAIARADRSGASFLPAEAAACPLIERGEVDAVIVVGGATAAVETAIRHAGRRPAVVRIASGSAATMRDAIAELAAALAAGHATAGGPA